MKWLQNGNLAKLVAFFVIAVVITCTVSFAANGWQSFINPGQDKDSLTTDNSSDNNASGEKDETNNLEDTPVALPVPKYYHSITGLETTLEDSLKRPLAFVFSSNDPLYGISSSYLTIELPTEYGNTRLLCFTDEAKTLGKIGSLAPSRGYISNFATYFGGILLSYGSDDTFDYKYTEPRDKLDFKETVGFCYSEFNSFNYTNADLVNAFLNNSKIGQASADNIKLPYTFVDTDSQAVPEGNDANTVTVTYADNNVTQLNYSAFEKCYVLSKNSVAKNDLLNDKPLKYDNVFVLYADSTTYETEESTQLILDTYSKGSGIYASHGRYVEIIWERDVSGNLIFRTPEGEQITVNRGTSYICVVKSSLKSSTKIN